MMQWLEWVQWITPLALVGISLMVGLWLRGFVIPRLNRWASRVGWEANTVMIRPLRGLIVLWSVMAGLYVAAQTSELALQAISLIGTALKVLWIVSVTWLIADAVSHLISQYSMTWRMGFQVTSLTQNITKLAILVLGFLIVLESLGVKITSLLAALGIGSLAVALGLQDTLTNLFAGVYISVGRHVNVGDYIKLEGGEEGYVADIGWRQTKIRTLPNNLIVVPNAKLSQTIVTNYYLPDKELAVLVEVGVDYASDLERVERVTCEVAREIMRTVAGGVIAFEPFIRYHTFGDSSIHFTVILRAKEFTDQYLLKHEFIKQLHKRYQQEGITIPFPIRTLHLKSTGAATERGPLQGEH